MSKKGGETRKKKIEVGKLGEKRERGGGGGGRGEGRKKGGEVLEREGREGRRKTG